MKILLLLFLFIFSCTSVEIPSDLPRPETSLSGGYWCVYFNEQRCDFIGSSTTCPGESSLASSCPYSYNEPDEDDEEEQYFSPTHCTDGEGRYLYCQWDKVGCFALDPAFALDSEGAPDPNADCISQEGNCGNNKLYFISTEGEGIPCDGIKVY